LQQQPDVLLCALFILLVAYNEAPASIIAAVTPMIIFFIVLILNIINKNLSFWRRKTVRIAKRCVD
jgi:hypothetical protein